MQTISIDFLVRLAAAASRLVRRAQRSLFAQILRLGDEHSWIFRRQHRPGVLPSRLKRPQSRHHAPLSHSLAIFIKPHWDNSCKIGSKVRPSSEMRYSTFGGIVA